MFSRKSSILAGMGALLLGSGAYFMYSLFAAQAQGELAQAPLNSVSSAPPAFIMAVDDSNSMTFERIFAGGDGRMRWNGSSFFSSAGVFYDVGTACDGNSVDCYLYLFPHSGYNRSYSYGRAIPPLDIFGFARSPAYNAGYFNPSVKYDPWRLAAADASGNVLMSDATPSSTRADPRSGSDFSNDYGTIYNLTANRAVTSESFAILVGMTVPKGTSYYANGEVCNTTYRSGRNTYSNNDGLPDTGGKWGTLSNDWVAPTNCQLPIQYFPATFYLPEATPAPAGYKTDATSRPLIKNACGPGCNLYRYTIVSGNYSSGYADAIKNYANWFQYHRNRILSMVGSSTHAMGQVENMRIGYFTINNRTNVTMYDAVKERSSLFNQILSLKPNGGTPNRQAVDFLGQQFQRTGTGAPVALACQRNGGMLFTDGYTNTNSASATDYGNADSTGSTHFPGAPFADGYKNTIADIAAAYYDGPLVPLRKGDSFPAGQVPVSKQCSTLDKSSADWKRMDCQTNLHMNFYAVTLGAQGKIFEVNQAATKDPYTNAPNWNANGDPTASDDGRVIDELWHATINTRGEFINAKTPSEVTAAMRRVLSAVAAGSSPSGSIALTGARIGAGSLSVTPRYEVANEGTDWFSRLTASQVSVNPSTRATVFTPIWEASTKLTSPSARKVFFANGTSVSPFSSSNVTLDLLCGTPAGKYPAMSRCNASDLTALGADADSAVAYLLGDTSKEVRNGGKLRDRTAVLGDIINSAPVISSPIDDYGYRSLAGLGASYDAYMKTKKGRGYMVYVGANDGMLHAFDGGMDAAGKVTAAGGSEAFAYIPATSVGHMGNLLRPYNALNAKDQVPHRYFVDGPLAVGDTYYGGDWHTTLVGTTGAGGRGVFALDVSAPGSFNSSSRLWEINDLTGGSQAIRDNIGFVLGKPVIVPVKSGNSVSWKAIFGNGYNSASGKAVLFVVDIGTGTPNVRMIEATESGTGAPGGVNGLGNIVVLDRKDNSTPARAVRDGFADTVYGADANGAIWKFDLLSTSNSVSTPVFTTLSYVESKTTYRQPITGGLAATAGEGGGVRLIFGSGSFSFLNDPSDTSIQSLYAFTDRSDTTTTTVTRANLTPYAVSTGTDGLSRTVKLGTAPSASQGWYIDLPSGERFVGNPEVVSGMVFLPTYAASLSTTGCSTVGKNWLFGLDVRTGAPALSNVRVGSPTGKSYTDGTAAVALDTGGTAPVKDALVSTAPRPPVMPLAPGTPPPPPPHCVMAINVSGSEAMYLPAPCGRQSWRQIQ